MHKGMFRGLDCIEVHGTGMTMFSPDGLTFTASVDDTELVTRFCQIPMDILADVCFVKELRLLLITFKEDMY